MPKSTKYTLIGALVLLTTGAVLADVQVLNIKDSQTTGTSPRLADATGIAGPGTSDRLCVVNTTPGKGISWKTLNTQTGATILYRQSAFFANGIPASPVTRTTATRPHDGNVAKWIGLAPPIPAEGGEWSSGVTLQATSL